MTAVKHCIKDLPNIIIGEDLADGQNDRRTEEIQHMDEDDLILRDVRGLETTLGYSFNHITHGFGGIGTLDGDDSDSEELIDG